MLARERTDETAALFTKLLTRLFSRTAAGVSRILRGVLRTTANGKGGHVVFDPATFHAAGENRTTSVQRFANLMQVGSAYGRSIEIVDRCRITLAVYDDLKRLLDTGTITKREADNVVAATAEGYPFRANLDIDSPLTGMAPQSQQDVLRQALAENWDLAKLRQVTKEQNERKRSH